MIKYTNRTGEKSQWIRVLSQMHEGLSSNPQTHGKAWCCHSYYNHSMMGSGVCQTSSGVREELYLKRIRQAVTN